VNVVELNVAMLRKQVNAEHMAKVIGKSRTMYDRRRFGDMPFTVDEILLVAKELDLDLLQVNEIFFDNVLRFREQLSQNDKNLA